MRSFRLKRRSEDDTERSGAAEAVAGEAEAEPVTSTASPPTGEREREREETPGSSLSQRSTLPVPKPPTHGEPAGSTGPPGAGPSATPWAPPDPADPRHQAQPASLGSPSRRSARSEDKRLRKEAAQLRKAEKKNAAKARKSVKRGAQPAPQDALAGESSRTRRKREREERRAAAAARRQQAREERDRAAEERRQAKEGEHASRPAFAVGSAPSAPATAGAGPVSVGAAAGAGAGLAGTDASQTADGGRGFSPASGVASKTTPATGNQPIHEEAARPTRGVPDRSERTHSQALSHESRIVAEADRWITEAERASQASTDPDPAASEPPAQPPRNLLLAELERAERQLEQRRDREEDLARELKLTEERLAESQERTAAALSRAGERLQEIEARAAEAEARATRAERLARLRAEEIERAERLRELLDRIADAERRAAEAEERARATVDRLSDPVPDPVPNRIFELEEEAPGVAPAVAGDEIIPVPFEVELDDIGSDEIAPAPVPAAPEKAPVGPFDQAAAPPRWAERETDDPGARTLDRFEAREIAADAAAEAAEPPPTTAATGTVASAGEPRASHVDLNSASHDDLRELGLSVTQTGRVLAYRERSGGFTELDELDSIPGFPREFIKRLKREFTV